MKHIKVFYSFLLFYHAVSEHKLIVKHTSCRAIDILILNKSLFASVFEVW